MGALKKLAGALLTAAIILLVARAVVSYLIFIPRVSSPDEYQVALTYYQAQGWGLSTVARNIQTPAFKAAQDADGREMLNDVFLAHGLTVLSPETFTGRDGADRARFKVTYVSRWTGPSGEPPGQRVETLTLMRIRGGWWQVESVTREP